MPIRVILISLSNIHQRLSQSGRKPKFWQKPNNVANEWKLLAGPKALGPKQVASWNRVELRWEPRLLSAYLKDFRHERLRIVCINVDRLSVREEDTHLSPLPRLL